MKLNFDYPQTDTQHETAYRHQQKRWDQGVGYKLSDSDIFRINQAQARRERRKIKAD